MSERNEPLITRTCCICGHSTGIDYRISDTPICQECADRLRKLLYGGEQP